MAAKALREEEVAFLKALSGALQELAVNLYENNISEILIGGGEDPISAIARKYGLAPDDLLDEAVKRGLLKPLVADRLVFCPKCGNTSFKARYTCPSCGSSDATKITLFSHVSCGYIGILEDAPRDRKSGIVCPKCSKPLGAQGRDWIIIGITYKCRSCGLTFNIPATKLECLSCNNVFDHRDALYKEVFKYSVDADALANIYAQVLAKRIAGVFSEKGYTVQSNVEVQSLSGIRRRVPMLAEKGSRKVVVYTVFPRGGDVAQAREDVLSAYGKALDSGEENLVIAVKTPADLSRKPSNTEVIEGKGIEDVTKKLREWLK